MRTLWILVLFGSLITYHCLTPVSAEGSPSAEPTPSFDQCKPYVDAALKTGSSPDASSSSKTDSTESPPGEDSKEDDQDNDTDENASPEQDADGDSNAEDSKEDNVEEESEEKEGEDGESKEHENEQEESEEKDEHDDSGEDEEKEVKSVEEQDDSEAEGDTKESSEDGDTTTGDSAEDNDTKEVESQEGDEEESQENAEDDTATAEDDSGEDGKSDEQSSDNVADQADQPDSAENEEEETKETEDSAEDTHTAEAKADVSEEEEDDGKSKETAEDDDEEKSKEESAEGDGDADQSEEQEEKSAEEGKSGEGDDEHEGKSDEEKADTESGEDDADKSDETKDGESEEDGGVAGGEDDEQTESEEESQEEEEEEEVEQYTPRSRDHVTDILGLDDSDTTKKTFSLLNQATQITLKELKRIYENAIKPLETMYKYRDLSNRHFGDPEIFSKPLIVFMGPWSGGKSTIINWLLDIQHEETALRTGADPSPAQFNIMMHGKEDETLDGTQLAADWTFSGLQKFGQSFLDRLRGRRLPNRLLEKVNIVEIPGILEVRKQVERSFPFNDACQWFIDRADVLFLVYDPAKLDIGPETEAILDQLKGRESQVRIVLNKADTVTPDELLRVQAMLVWNISPLMSSAEPPTMYAASLWDRPLQPDSPKSLLTAHEGNFLKDIRDGIHKQVETRIAAARRFAVRVRNHAKMVDCYLNTYNNHRSFFSDKKKISGDIIDHPQNYHIYEGLSTLTNISRYDLPDPDTYKDFFKLNNLWNFPTLSSTCSYFRGCPINKLDLAIAYELPDLLGKFRRQREAILTAQAQKSNEGPK